MENIAPKLTAEDLEALCDEATRQNRSLSCLIGALEDGEPILSRSESALQNWRRMARPRRSTKQELYDVFADFDIADQAVVLEFLIEQHRQNKRTHDRRALLLIAGLMHLEITVPVIVAGERSLSNNAISHTAILFWIGMGQRKRLSNGRKSSRNRLTESTRELPLGGLSKER